MRPRTATIGSVSFNVSKKKSLPWGPHAAGAGSSLDHTEEGRDSPTTPTRKTSLFDSFRPRSKSDATRKLSHRRVPMVRPDFFQEQAGLLMGDDIGLGLSSMPVCFDFLSTNVVQLSNRNP